MLHDILVKKTVVEFSEAQQIEVERKTETRLTVQIQETLETKKDGRGGCLFKSVGKKGEQSKLFFLPFERFCFV